MFSEASSPCLRSMNYKNKNKNKTAIPSKAEYPTPSVKEACPKTKLKFQESLGEKSIIVIPTEAFLGFFFF